MALHVCNLAEIAFCIQRLSEKWIRYAPHTYSIFHSHPSCQCSSLPNLFGVLVLVLRISFLLFPFSKTLPVPGPRFCTHNIWQRGKRKAYAAARFGLVGNCMANCALEKQKEILKTKKIQSQLMCSFATNVGRRQRERERKFENGRRISKVLLA